MQTVFDTTVGILVLLYAITQGLLPEPPQLPDLPAFEISFWANHPQTLLIVIGVLLLAIAIGVYYLAHHVRRFWDRVKQGLAILSQPRRYLREVAAWQGLGWLCRFAAFWFFLEAFGIGGSVGNVMLVMSVQAIATIVPFTPGGAGAQQALLVATLNGPLALRRPLLLGRHPDRDGGLVGRARLRRDPARLQDDGLERADQTGARRCGARRRRWSGERLDGWGPLSQSRWGRRGIPRSLAASRSSRSQQASVSDLPTKAVRLAR